MPDKVTQHCSHKHKIVLYIYIFYFIFFRTAALCSCTTVDWLLRVPDGWSQWHCLRVSLLWSSLPLYKACCFLSVFFLYHRNTAKPNNSSCYPSTVLFCLSPTLHPRPLCATAAALWDILSINCPFGITSPRMYSKSPSGQLYIDFQHVLCDCLF